MDRLTFTTTSSGLDIFDSQNKKVGVILNPHDTQATLRILEKERSLHWYDLMEIIARMYSLEIEEKPNERNQINTQIIGEVFKKLAG